MSESTLLSDLCSICNTNKSKYRCPGCAARTCSLPCYKRHQQWAQCSGQRDPTKFVKKSQLVTPAGIDHDFNFLTGIERNLEKAERTVNTTSKSRQGETNYSRLETLAGVKIIAAPKGLTRQRENKSRPSSTKKAKLNVVWTVEWFDAAKRRALSETSSTSSIADAHPFVQHKSKKRKLGVETSSLSNSTIVEDGANPPTNQDKPLKSLELELELELDINKQKLQELPSGPRASPHPQEQGPQTAQRETHLAGPNPPNPRHDGPSTQPVGDGQYRFFLLRPRTSSSRHVLIPLTPSNTLAESLRGRTVLEFPTIYAFPGAMAQLPEEFMLEEEYLRQEGEAQKEFDELMKELDPEILRRLKEDGRKVDRAKEEEVDSKKILDVLKQDLGAGF